MGFFSKSKGARMPRRTSAVGPLNDTAVEMEYEMWCLPMHHFVGLTRMMPHQELLRQGKLARYDS